jgi:hypothetical protein
MTSMRRVLPLVMVFGLALALAGCGGCDNGGSAIDGDVTEPDAPFVCVPTGFACAGDDQCCVGHCDMAVNLCVQRPTLDCSLPGDACELGLECCTLACVDNRCSSEQCTADNAACEADGECCGGSCDNGRCTPLAACATAGNPCAGHADCCSRYCGDDGFCEVASFCRQTGDVCTADSQCCGGMCERAPGESYGLCKRVDAPGGSQCTGAGEVCGAGANWDGEALPTCGGDCCSRACQPYGPTGVLICQPSSGCRPRGEVCREDDDCCGSINLPDGERTGVTCSKVAGNEYGRCDSGNACTPAGAICRLQTDSCNAPANCCAGNVLQFDTCKLDNLGIPRCVVQEIDCGDPTDYVGQECATAADCCGLPCLPNPGGDPPLICGGACVEEDGECTTTADCCSGPCTFTPGEPTGFCGPPSECLEYGQQCDGSTPCCNSIPCSNGVCQIG